MRAQGRVPTAEATIVAAAHRRLRKALDAAPEWETTALADPHSYSPNSDSTSEGY